MVLCLKECLVKCETVCLKGVVILSLTFHIFIFPSTFGPTGMPCRMCDSVLVKSVVILLVFVVDVIWKNRQSQLLFQPEFSDHLLLPTRTVDILTDKMPSEFYKNSCRKNQMAISICEKSSWLCLMPLFSYKISEKVLLREVHHLVKL